MGKTAMSVVPVDEMPRSVYGTAKRDSFWQRFAQALDAYFAGQTKRAVPEITLRRSKHDLARCRRLLHKHIAAPIETRLGGGRVAKPRPRS
jgi:hypothetical protein